MDEVYQAERTYYRNEGLHLNVGEWVACSSCFCIIDIRLHTQTSYLVHQMTNFVPIFPLEVVVFPGEILNLHVFEPQYKQLINECCGNVKPFGISTVLNGQIAEMGTLVEVYEMTQVYEGGKMDIRVQGLKVFRILEIIKPIPDKIYSGAIVNYPDNITDPTNTAHTVLDTIRDLHCLLNMSKDFKKADESLTSYDIAHLTGLSLEEAYELLGLLEETQRIEYLKRHLAKVLPVMAGIEGLKDTIKYNGHFKALKGFNFDF